MLYLFKTLCFGLVFFVFKWENWPAPTNLCFEQATLFREETLKHVFPCEFCPIYKNAFFLEHLGTVASETGTEKGVGNLAQSKEFSPQR